MRKCLLGSNNYCYCFLRFPLMLRSVPLNLGHKKLYGDNVMMTSNDEDYGTFSVVVVYCFGALYLFMLLQMLLYVVEANNYVVEC